MKYPLFLLMFLFYLPVLRAQQGSWSHEYNAVTDPNKKLQWLITAVVEERFPDKKEEMLAAGFRLAADLDNDSLTGKMYMLSAYSKVGGSQFKEGWADYEKAKVLLLKGRAYESFGRVHTTQTWMLLVQGHTDSALRFMDRNRPLLAGRVSPPVLLGFDANYATAYRAKGQYDLAGIKYRDIITRAAELQDTPIFAANCINFGAMQESLDSALFWFRKAAYITRGSKLPAYPEVMMQIALLYMQRDGAVRDSTLHYLRLAEQYKDNLRSDLNRNNLYNLEGSFFFSKGEFKLALRAFEKAYDYFKSEGKTSNMVINNIALCYIRLGKPDSAWFHIGKYKGVIDRIGGDDYEKMLYHQTLAEYYTLITNDSCSLSVLNEKLEALEYAAAISETRIGSELLLSSLNCVLNRKALQSQGKRLLSFCRVYYEPLKREEKLYNYSLFLMRYAALEARYGDKDKAIELFNENASVFDRFVGEEYMRGMDEALVKYKSELKDTEIALLNQKEKSAGLRIAFISSGLALVTFVMGLIYVLYRRESKSKRLLDERNHKVEQLLREVHHRVKNNLQIVSSFINIQLDKVNDGEAADALRDTSTRIMALAGLHHSLYRQDDLSRIQLREYIEELCRNIGHTINTDVRITCDLEDLSLDMDQAIPVGLAVNEMITNALKHAFTGKEQGQINVSLHKKKNWELIVKDNGKGIPEIFDPALLQSIGIRLVQDLAEHQLKGKFSFYNDGGAVFKIGFMPVV